MFFVCVYGKKEKKMNMFLKKKKWNMKYNYRFQWSMKEIIFSCQIYFW